MNSLKLVSKGEADVAAVDCVTHELLKRYRISAIDTTFVPYAQCAGHALHYEALRAGQSRGKATQWTAGGLR